MLGYLKNLSTFRVIVLIVLVTAAGFHIYGRYARSNVSGAEAEQYRKVYDALLESADAFGTHILAQESLGMALALQLESLENVDDSERINQLLKFALDNSAVCVQGVGASVSGAGGQPRELAYLSKYSPNDNRETAARIAEMIDDAIRRAGDSKVERTRRWNLMVNPPSGTDSRFSSFLSVSWKGKRDEGEALVRGDLGWLAGILEKLGEVGGKDPLCFTPNGDALWLDNGRLVFDLDYQPSDKFAEKGKIARARSLVDGKIDAEDSEFIRSDVLGSGWQLVVANPKAAGDADFWSPATFLFCVAALVLILEALISRLAGAWGLRLSGDGMRGSLDESAIAPGGGGGRSALHTIYAYLFRYRIANPDRERVESELRLARQIQFSLVPDSFPAYSEWREFDLYSMLSPAREVGGDYYDFFMLDANRLVLAVGDVSGTGFPAALYMAVCRTAFRTIARRAANTGQLMTLLNDTLVRDNHSGLYVTIACFIIELSTGKCEYVLAGHPAPILHESATGQTRFIDTPRETFAGVKAGIDFPVGELNLGRGDTLLLYTDGVPEARNKAGDELEYERLRGMFHDLSVAERCQNLIGDLEKSVRGFVGDQEKFDDITLLAFRYWGPGGQKMLKRRQQTSARRHANGPEE